IAADRRDQQVQYLPVNEREHVNEGQRADDVPGIASWRIRFFLRGWRRGRGLDQFFFCFHGLPSFSDDSFVLCLLVGARVRRDIDFEVWQFQGFEDVLTVLAGSKIIWIKEAFTFVAPTEPIPLFTVESHR